MHVLRDLGQRTTAGRRGQIAFHPGEETLNQPRLQHADFGTLINPVVKRDLVGEGDQFLFVRTFRFDGAGVTAEIVGPFLVLLGQ